MNESFVSEVEYCIEHSSDKVNLYDYESRYGKINIKYNIEIEARDWGVKSIIITAPEQVLNLDLELQSLKDDEDIVYKSFKINLKNIEIENPTTFGQINPTELSLTLKDIKHINEHESECDATGILIF
jgi:hypothetical protein